MNKKTIIIAIALVAILGGIFGWMQYNKPHRDATSEKAAYQLTAAALFEAFELNEAEASEKYLDKLLEVSGTVSEYNNDEQGNASVLLESDDMLFGVKCMLAEIPEKPAVNGNAIIIKGFCSGLNGDVEMTRCAIIK